jgi:hypothetical protein
MCGGGSFYLPSASLPEVSSEPPARQAERCGKRGRGSGSSHLSSASLPAVASRLQDKPSATETGGVGRQPLPCDLKRLNLDYTAVTIRGSSSKRYLAGRQRTAPQA